ncbi:MAG: type I glutamate--ammonia ligase [Gammaproteobacteria bacterium]|nr:MAG: type I glutamate--ammonia ligase [Gammaproteobacteria bacterium]
MTPNDVMKLIKEKEAKFADLRFTDTRGKEQHVTIPARLVDEELFRDGKMFDGSSIAGWKGINESDMILMPEANTAVIDPFFEETTVNIRCDVIEPATMQGYERDPRSLAKRAEAYLKSTGIADYALFGPENEFFIFDSVRSGSDVRGCFYEIDSVQGAWNSSKDYPEGNKGHRPGYKGGYFPVPPVDAFQDIRSAMCLACEEMGLKVGTLVQKSDQVQILKYCVHNVANGYGKSATFMPKPLVGDNGNGMHVHQSLQKEGRALFAGDKYGGLSDLALYYIGGVIKHAKALNAITNPGTNSYKRLVPGFEAPTLLAYSARNRSASIRIPWVSNPKARRIEVRFPDSAANPYFAFAAMMMAGLDGIQNKIHPGDPSDKDLYDLEPEEAKHIPTVCHSLDMALEHLDRDREFLTRGGVFTNDVLDAYVGLKVQELTRFRMATHPVEIEMYYSV